MTRRSRRRRRRLVKSYRRNRMEIRIFPIHRVRRANFKFASQSLVILTKTFVLNLHLLILMLILAHLMRTAPKTAEIRSSYRNKKAGDKKPGGKGQQKRQYSLENSFVQHVIHLIISITSIHENRFHLSFKSTVSDKIQKASHPSASL